MQLTKEHIQTLYDFTKQHHVEYYDLQTELVDHLANDIENIWSESPSLTFEQARYKATIKFGIYGFSKFVSQREKAHKKENWRLFKKFFIEYFKLPKLMLTLFLITLVYVGFGLSTDKTTMLFISMMTIHGIAVFYALFISLKYKIRRKRNGKKWLYEEVITSSGLFFLFIVVFQPFHIYNFIQSDISIHWSFIVQLLWSIGIVVFGMVFYITLWIIPPKFQAIIKKHEVA